MSQQPENKTVVEDSSPYFHLPRVARTTHRRRQAVVSQSAKGPSRKGSRMEEMIRNARIANGLSPDQERNAQDTVRQQTVENQSGRRSEQDSMAAPKPTSGKRNVSHDDDEDLSQGHDQTKLSTTSTNSVAKPARQSHTRSSAPIMERPTSIQPSTMSPSYMYPPVMPMQMPMQMPFYNPLMNTTMPYEPRDVAELAQMRSNMEFMAKQQQIINEATYHMQQCARDTGMMPPQVMPGYDPRFMPINPQMQLYWHPMAMSGQMAQPQMFQPQLPAPQLPAKQPEKPVKKPKTRKYDVKPPPFPSPSPKATESAFRAITFEEMYGPKKVPEAYPIPVMGPSIVPPTKAPVTAPVTGPPPKKSLKEVTASPSPAPRPQQPSSTAPEKDLSHLAANGLNIPSQEYLEDRQRRKEKAQVRSARKLLQPELEAVKANSSAEANKDGQATILDLCDVAAPTNSPRGDANSAPVNTQPQSHTLPQARPESSLQALSIAAASRAPTASSDMGSDRLTAKTNESAPLNSASEHILTSIENGNVHEFVPKLKKRRPGLIGQVLQQELDRRERWGPVLKTSEEEVEVPTKATGKKRRNSPGLESGRAKRMRNANGQYVQDSANDGVEINSEATTMLGPNNEKEK